MGKKIFLYLPNGGKSGKRLKRVIHALVSKERIEIFPSVGSLSRQLRQPQPREGNAIAVLLAENGERLLEIISVGELLKDFPIILILPDREDGTVSKGHRLRPRFMTYADSDFFDVAAVLSKMLEQDYLDKLALRRDDAQAHESWY